MQEDLTSQIVIRVSSGLRKALEKDAKENERMLAQSVRYHLKKAVQLDR